MYHISEKFKSYAHHDSTLKGIYFGIFIVTLFALSFRTASTLEETKFYALDAKEGSSRWSSFIHPVTWPPEIGTSPGPWKCEIGGEEESRRGVVFLHEAYGRMYCVTKVSEKALGHTYTRYAYSWEENGTVKNFSFSLRFSRCEDYGEPQRSACEAELKAFSPDILLSAPHSFGQPVEICYYYRAKTESGFYDRAWIQMTLGEASASGELWSLPSLAPPKIGRFQGMLGPLDPDSMQRTATLSWQVLSEGRRKKEDLAVEFNHYTLRLAPALALLRIDCERLEDLPLVELEKENFKNIMGH